MEEEKLFTLSELEVILEQPKEVLLNKIENRDFPNARKWQESWLIPQDDLVAEIERQKKSLSDQLDRFDGILKSLGSIKARSPREEIHTCIEFTPDFDIIPATGVDISEDGICFQTDESLPFAMQFDLEGKTHTYRAHLMWMSATGENGGKLGFRFVKNQDDE